MSKPTGEAITLRNCGYCGDKGALKSVRGGPRGWGRKLHFVQCKDCKRESMAFYEQEKTIEHWNTNLPHFPPKIEKKLASQCQPHPMAGEVDAGLNAVLKTCTEVSPGNGYCDHCAAGKPEFCRYTTRMVTSKAIDELLRELAQLKREGGR